MKEIPLTRGYVAIVDEEDYSRVSAHKWCAFVINRADGSARVYALRRIINGEGCTTQLMHRMIMGSGNKLQVDHIDGDGLNNTKRNLRFCTQAENQHNQRARTGTSVYKGVHWNTEKRKWRSRIKINKKDVHLGYFASETDAARAYDAGALKYFGEFARTNVYFTGATND